MYRSFVACAATVRSRALFTLLLLAACGGTEEFPDCGMSGVTCCESAHVCENDVCTCETPGLEGEPCTDDDLCESECEVCEGDSATPG